MPPAVPGDLHMPPAVGADVVVTGEHQVQVIPERPRVISREPTRAVEEAHDSPGHSNHTHATRVPGVSPSSTVQLPSPARAATRARPRPCSSSGSFSTHGPPWSSTSSQA